MDSLWTEILVDVDSMTNNLGDESHSKHLKSSLPGGAFVAIIMMKTKQQISYIMKSPSLYALLHQKSHPQ